MTRFLVPAVVLLAGSPVIGADPSAFKAGVSAKVITPDRPMWMAGYAARTKPAEEKEHDLYAKALVLEDAGGKRLVLVTADLIGFPRGLADEVARGVEKRYGVKRDELMLAASHTHCGPVVPDNLSDMYPLTPGEAEKVAAYGKKLVVDVIDLIGDALKNLGPATLRFGRGDALFAMNRREPTPAGITNGKNPGGPVDHSVPVLVVAGADGQPRAVVFGYACHNTTLPYYRWCGDYAGFAQLDIEKALPGATALFWAGCGGDANPQPRGTVELCRQHGRELADAVIGVVKGELTPLAGRFTSKYDKIPLRLDALPTKDQLAADALSRDLARRARAGRLLKELEATGKIADTYPHYPVQTWGLGDQVAWVALGGEVVVDYALRLKKELPPGRALWVTAYANDVMAYIPSARVLKEGGYEADSSMVYYGLPGRWHPSVEDTIAAKVKQQAAPQADLKAPGPLSPKEEQATFRVNPGFKVELVAAEPDVVDPVAMCFDERGRLFVAEMRGYPNGGVGTGTESRGRVRCLTDRDGDGTFETATTFADGLRFPMGLQPYQGGLLVAVAPDLLYLEDTDDDGKADRKTVLYSGFNLANIQQMVNSLQWGLDNWVYGCAGSDGGTVRSAEKPGAPEVSLRNRGLRFRPWLPGSLEPTSGGGQYGLAADDYGRWFTATNSQHLRQIVLPDEYLRRNPYFPVPAATVDIPEHGPAAKVYRVSPFEPWRVERTTRRAGGADAKRFPSTELIPGGFITSACSPLVYTADLFPAAYRGNNFVCDPANNLIHRETLEPDGVLFKAKRADAGREFLASTDNWFRPVHLTVGPDGAVYVLDFYREVIETPLSLPDDIKARLNLESRGRGRIWRIAPEGFKPGKMPDLSRATVGELADALLKPNPWWRLTAQRLIVERQLKEAAPLIRKRLAGATGKPGHANLLWTLDGLGELTPADLDRAFFDPKPGVREQALRLAEWFPADSPELRRQAGVMVCDPVTRVRFQVALSAGRLPSAARAEVLADLLSREPDPWVRTAALVSAGDVAAAILDRLDRGTDSSVLSRLAAIVGARGDAAGITRVLSRVAGGGDAALLAGLGEGMRSGKKPLAAWLADPPADAEPIVSKLRDRFMTAAAAVRDDARPAAERVAAADLLALVPFAVAGPALAEALTPSAPGDVQAAAVKALAAHSDAGVGPLLLKPWAGYGPALRATVLDALASRPDRAVALLDAVTVKAVAAGELPPALVQQLKTHPAAEVRAKAAAVLTATVDPDRAKVVAEYTKSIDLKPDPARGKGLFKTHCAACHKLDGVGQDVGPNLLAVLPNKSPADLLVAVFDPNREVDPRYVSYQAATADGRVLTGVVAAETPAGVTIRRADGAEDTVLRANLEALRSTRLSLMPEGLEKQLRPQDVADLFGYLRTAGK